MHVTATASFCIGLHGGRTGVVQLDALINNKLRLCSNGGLSRVERVIYEDTMRRDRGWPSRLRLVLASLIRNLKISISPSRRCRGMNS